MKKVFIKLILTMVCEFFKETKIIELLGKVLDEELVVCYGYKKSFFLSLIILKAHHYHISKSSDQCMISFLSETIKTMIEVSSYYYYYEVEKQTSCHLNKTKQKA